MGLLSSGEVWAADGLSLYVTRDDGSHWQLFHPPGIGGDLATSLTGFASAGTKDMWLGGITGRGFGTRAHPTVPARARLVFSYGSVDHTTDGAAAGPRPLCPNVVSQARSASPTPSTAAPSARRLVAARTRPRGRLYRTLDGGRSWQVRRCPSKGCWSRRTAVAQLPSEPSEGFAASSYASSLGSLYRTSDGWRKWQQVTMPVPPGYSDRAVFGTPQFFSAELGVVPALLEQRSTGAPALVVFTTDDGGLKWSAVQTPAGKDLGPYLADGTVPFSAASESSWSAYPAHGSIPLGTEGPNGQGRHRARLPRWRRPSGPVRLSPDG
jgi:hypothetical protein